MSTAHNALIYGHTWYLDAVTNVLGWKWEGLVIGNVPDGHSATHYEAVLPIPLRRRWGRWVVYQPLFCQFVALFSPQQLDPTPLLLLVYERYRHVSKWHLLLNEPLPGLAAQVRQQVMYTHILPLQTVGSYTPDRRMNLRRAARRIANVPDWRVTESADIEPLLTLFRENHADEIGAAEWAYALFRELFSAVQKQHLGTLRYAWANGQIVAGAMFVAQHGRVIYLFNAANSEGRRLNARSILIDELIRDEQHKAASVTPPTPLMLDFESPEKPGVVSFYESFGATPQPYIVFSWSRSTWLERLVIKAKAKLGL